MEKSYDVFISFKNTNSNGDYTEDSRIARELYDAFKNSGLHPFYSEESLGEIGSSDYTSDIENAIKNSKAMVVVLTKAEYAKSRWVEKEWQAFDHYYLNNERDAKNLFTLTKKVDVSKLPITLSSVENFDYKNGIDPVIKTIHAIAEKPISKRYRRIQLKLKLRPIVIGIALFLLFSLGVCVGHFGTRLYDMIFNNTEATLQPGDVQNNTQGTQSNGSNILIGQHNSTQGQPNSAGTNNNSTATNNNSTATNNNSNAETENDPTTGGLEIADQNNSSSPTTGKTRENPFPIELNTTYTGNLSKGDDTLWCKFRTGSAKAVYRLTLTPDIPKEEINKGAYTPISIAIYDPVGILIEDKEIYYHHGELGYMDLYLDPNTEYCIKTTGDRFEDGTIYTFTLQAEEKPCDVGTDVESATVLTLGQRYEAVLDSTLSEYFVFKPQKNGYYTVTLHNINTGTNIEMYCDTKTYIESYNGWSATAENENHASKNLNISAGYPYYFKIYTKKYETNGKYIIVIEEKK